MDLVSEGLSSFVPLALLSTVYVQLAWKGIGTGGRLFGFLVMRRRRRSEVVMVMVMNQMPGSMVTSFAPRNHHPQPPASLLTSTVRW